MTGEMGGGDWLARRVGEMLRERGMTLATAESCTGGMIAALITSVAGSSDYFREGIVAYANEAKTRLLGVPAEVIQEHGAVSRETAAAMARGLLHRSGVHMTLATTGIAGPGGGTPAKPVGTVFIAIADHGEIAVTECHFTGDRAEIRQQTTRRALELLLIRIEGGETP
ncbi:MAG: hypothetical protein Fur0034_01030 [Desulfuromonadia bacterium]